MKQPQQSRVIMMQRIVLSVLALALLVQSVACVITVQIGGATRLNSLTRQRERERERYSCWWDCDLVGCQIARDDDECAYDCEKICRVKYDYAAASAASAVGRSGNSPANEKEAAASSNDQLAPKSSIPAPAAGAVASGSSNEFAPELMGAGTSVRLHMPRNASLLARNFAIWERCSVSSDTNTGAQLTVEKPFSL